MTSPSAPAQMQAEIFERLIKKDGSTNEGSKADFKFGKSLEDPFGECVKDIIYHKIDTRFVSAKPGVLKEFFDKGVEHGTFVTQKSEHGATLCVFRFDGKFIAFLARALFGADLDKDLIGEWRAPTASERAMAGYFGELIYNQIPDAPSLKDDAVKVFTPDEIDPDEIDSMSGTVVTYEVTINDLKVSFSALIDANLANGTSDDLGFSGAGVHNRANEEILQSKVPASVTLLAQSKTLYEIQQLKPGDHLALSEIGGLIGKLVVKDREIFSGQVGRSGDLFSFRITDALEPPTF